MEDDGSVAGVEVFQDLRRRVAESQAKPSVREKPRRHGQVAARLTVFFHTDRNKPGRPPHKASRLMHLHPMTVDSLELIAAARRGAERAWRKGFVYIKAGIMLDDFVAAKLPPRTLFEVDPDKHGRLMEASDEINVRCGKSSAVPAAQGFERSWRMRAENMALAWTTEVGDFFRRPCPVDRLDGASWIDGETFSTNAEAVRRARA